MKIFWEFIQRLVKEKIYFLIRAVTESQTASSFLQLLTNALHDQHQIYDFILQNKTIMAALVGNGFLDNNTNFKMFQYVDTYKLTNDVGRTSKGKYQITKFSTLSRQRPKGQIYSSQIQSKGSVQMRSYSQLKSKDSLNNVVSLCPQARENALKGSADYSAPIQKADWLETQTQHILQIIYANDVTRASKISIFDCT